MHTPSRTQSQAALNWNRFAIKWIRRTIYLFWEYYITLFHVCLVDSPGVITIYQVFQAIGGWFYHPMWMHCCSHGCEMKYPMFRVSSYLKNSRFQRIHFMEKKIFCHFPLNLSSWIKMFILIGQKLCHWYMTWFFCYFRKGTGLMALLDKSITFCIRQLVSWGQIIIYFFIGDNVKGF